MRKVCIILPFVLIAGMLYACSSDDDSNLNEDIIQPVTLADNPIAEFFNSELPATNSRSSESFFCTSEAFEGIVVYHPIMTNVVCLINSRQELEAIYSGSRELPEIDFDKYTLIIGQQIMPCLGFYLAKKELQVGDEGLILKLYARNDSEIHAHMLQNLYYWELYPKLVQKVITVEDYKDYQYTPE